MEIKITHINDTEVEITGVIPADDFSKHRSIVIAKLGDVVEIDGFRRGHIPEAILVAKIGETRILEEMAERALGDAYPVIIIEHKIDAIGRPEITITKLAEGNPLEFKIKQTIMPKLELPDYKKLASEAVVPPLGGATAKDEITDKEVDDVISEIRKQKKGNPANEAEVPPVLDDIFAQSLGDFENVDDLKSKIRQNMTLEREMKRKSLHRQKIIETILEKTNFTMPAVFVEREMDKLLAELKDDIANMGMKFEDYLAHIKKT